MDRSRSAAGVDFALAFYHIYSAWGYVVKRYICLILGLVILGSWGVNVATAGEQEARAVTTEELRAIQQRVQQLEDNLRVRDERIRQLEEKLAIHEPVSPKASSVREQHGTHLSALEAERDTPFGGEFAVMPGGQDGPFDTSTDFFIAGALNVPLVRHDPLFGQKLLGEVMIGYGRSTDTGVFTTPLTLMVPSMGLPAGARIVSNRLETKFLQVFLGAKYKLVDYGLAQLQRSIQPYFVTGLGLNVILGRTGKAGVDTDGDGRPDVTLSALGFPGGLIGGVTPEAPELWRRGFPTGQGNIKLAYSIGGGLDVKLTERLFCGMDARYNILDGGGDYATYTGKVGFLW